MIGAETGVDYTRYPNDNSEVVSLGSSSISLTTKYLIAIYKADAAFPARMSVSIAAVAINLTHVAHCPRQRLSLASGSKIRFIFSSPLTPSKNIQDYYLLPKLSVVSIHDRDTT